MIQLRTRVLLVLFIGLVAACASDPLTGFDDIPEVDLFEQPVPDAPDPSDRAGAAAGYVECVHGLWNGGWSTDFGPTGSAHDPQGALALFLDSGMFGLPNLHYAATGRDGDRLLFTYSVDGFSKVAIIVADSALPSEDWEVETFASCDPSEYDPASDQASPIGVWIDADGNRTPTSVISSLKGAEHCGWESVTYLLYNDRQYISDPTGAMDGVEFVIPFESDTELPSDAVDTGYSREGRTLWLSADETVAYLVAEDRVEAWPTPDSPDPVWCG